jgi:hypothetical protein
MACSLYMLHGQLRADQILAAPFAGTQLSARLRDFLHKGAPVVPVGAPTIARLDDDKDVRSVADDEEASVVEYDSMALVKKKIPAHMEAELATLGGLNFIVILSVISSHFLSGRRNSELWCASTFALTPCLHSHLHMLDYARWSQV